MDCGSALPDPLLDPLQTRLCIVGLPRTGEAAATKVHEVAFSYVVQEGDTGDGINLDPLRHRLNRSSINSSSTGSAAPRAHAGIALGGLPLFDGTRPELQSAATTAAAYRPPAPGSARSSSSAPLAALQE